MREQLEGSQAVARAVARCRPEVVSAYPISPQTHIVEALSDMVRTGELAPCEYLLVESEFAAMSAAIGASAAGARAYTATASQGLLYMAEALYNASGLGLPIVMTLANRAIGAPINIWNDHSDAMSQRDSGWIQLYAESNQAAVDLHVQAFKLAEELSLPVMVCMDGFVLTHAVEPLEIPSQEQVDAFLPPYTPRQVLDPDEPVTIGAMVGPEAFTEVRYLAHAKQMQALDLVPELAAEFAASFGRPSGGLLRRYRTEGAETILVALGSVLGTIEDVVDELRDEGDPHRRARHHVLPALPARRDPRGARRRDPGRRGRARLRRRHRRHRRAERAARARRAALRSSTTSSPGSAAARSPAARCTGLFEDVHRGRIEPNRLHFLDLDWKLVERELRGCRRSAAPARTRRTSCATSASSRGGRTDGPPARSSSSRSAASPSATASSTRRRGRCSPTASGRTR